MNEQQRITVTVAGAGREADRWARALRGCDCVEVERVGGCDDAELLDSLARPGVAAIAIVTPPADLPGAIKRAVMARRHVLCAGPAALSSKRFAAIDELAHRRGRAIVFDTATLADDNAAFLARMVSGPGAIWRMRYLRSLRSGVLPGRSLDDLAIEDVAAALAIAGGMPAQVSAVAPRADDESGGPGVAMITLTFDGGPVARIDVSMLEPEPRHEIVVACEGRTIVLNPLDRVAPLQILAAGGHRGPRRGEDWSETVHEHPQQEPADRAACVAALFVEAVRANDANATNAGDLARAAVVWETARRSISAGGELLPVVACDGFARRVRPPLHVIEGGGRLIAGAERTTPELTIVARR